jgi:hypothetical protein
MHFLSRNLSTSCHICVKKGNRLKSITTSLKARLLPLYWALRKLFRSGFEIGAQRPSPGSIGKLKLSSEMRQRLEKVTANHSVRSTKTSEKPALLRDDGKVKRLEDNRKLLLEQQLGKASKDSNLSD